MELAKTGGVNGAAFAVPMSEILTTVANARVVVFILVLPYYVLHHYSLLITDR